MTGAAALLATAEPIVGDDGFVASLLGDDSPSSGATTSVATNPTPPPPPARASVTTLEEAPAPRISRRRPSRVPGAAKAAHWTFVWPAVPAAHYYDETFSRAGRTILQAAPRKPRLVVRSRGVWRGQAFRFSPGRYRWVVRPGFGPRARRDYGRPIVASTWIVR